MSLSINCNRNELNPMSSSDGHIKKAFAEESLEHLSSIEEDLIRIEKETSAPNGTGLTNCFVPSTPSRGGAVFWASKTSPDWPMPWKRF